MSRPSTKRHKKRSKTDDDLSQQINTLLKEQAMESDYDETPPEDAKQILIRLLQTAVKNIKLLGIILLVAVIWAGAYHLFAYIPAYQSDAKVIIKDSAINKRYVESEQQYDLKTTSSNNASPVLNTMQLIYSQTVSNHFFNFLKAKHPEVLEESQIETKRDWRKFFKNGQDFIAVKNIPGTDIIQLHFTWSDPVLAQDGLTEIIVGFQNASKVVNKAEELQRSAFIESRIESLTKKLVAIRVEKSTYQKSSHSLDAGNEGNNLSGNRLSMQIKLNNLEAQKQGKMAESNQYQNLLGLTPQEAFIAASIATNSAIVSEKAKLFTLQEEYAKLNSFYTEKSPQVKEVQSQINQVKATIDRELKKNLGSKYSPVLMEKVMITDSNRANIMQKLVQAEAEVARIENEAKIIQNGLSKIENRISEIPEISKTLLELDEQETTLSQGLNALRQKELEATLRESQTLSNIFVADPPSSPLKAEFPRPIHLYPIAIFLGLLVWLGILVIQDQFFNTPKLKTRLTESKKGFIEAINSDEGLSNSPVAQKLLKTLKSQKNNLL